MKHQTHRIGIIDIGSNSVRLVIYETHGLMGHKLIDESKFSARLSQTIKPDGSIPLDVAQKLVGILQHFKLLCEAHQVAVIRAAATAAIRNAVNSAEIVDYLTAESGLMIEILSGEKEAEMGFIGMINSLPIEIKDGFMIDIGGGSTELCLFKERRIAHSISIPYGAVNAAQIYYAEKTEAEGERKVKETIISILKQVAWISTSPRLPLVGLGGTIRNLSKIYQKSIQYSLPQTHAFVMNSEQMESVISMLKNCSLEKRKKINGLSKDRADIIIPGAAILSAVYEFIHATHYMISGSGLRDGLLYTTFLPQSPILNNTAEYSIHSLLQKHPSVPIHHVQKVEHFASTIVKELPFSQKSSRLEATKLLKAASMLYRIGISVNFYHYYRHTFYLISNSGMGGFTHRELLLCALIASYRSKKKCKSFFLMHQDILQPNDLEFSVKLGSVLQLSVALDRSETQPIERLEVEYDPQRGQLTVIADLLHSAEVERQAFEEAKKEFEKVWNLHAVLKYRHS